MLVGGLGRVHQDVPKCGIPIILLTNPGLALGQLRNESGCVPEFREHPAPSGPVPRCGGALRALAHLPAFLAACLLPSFEWPRVVSKAKKAPAPYSNFPLATSLVVWALLGVSLGRARGCVAQGVLVAVVEVAGAGPQRAGGRGSCRVGVLLSADPLAESLSPSATTVGGTSRCGPEKRGSTPVPVKCPSGARREQRACTSGSCTPCLGLVRLQLLAERGRPAGPTTARLRCWCHRDSSSVKRPLWSSYPSEANRRRHTWQTGEATRCIAKQSPRGRRVPSPLVRPVGRMSTTAARGPCLRGAPSSELMPSLS